jgi:hypothetical protein
MFPHFDKVSCTARLLQSELAKSGAIEVDVMDQLCKVFEGGWFCRYDT